MGPIRRPSRNGGAKARLTISDQNSTGLLETGFERFDLRPELLRALDEVGFTSPRPIQTEALPAALAGRDILGLAQTGTGKTAAFVLPILQRLMERKQGGPRALVVAPTRELAAQVHADFEMLGRHTGVRSVCVFGGVPVPRQIRALRANPDVVVACPGRLLDLLGQKALRLDRVEVLVLDEADHMFDMGFLPDVRRILRALPDRRQNLLFSATMPREIRGLADAVLQKPVVLELSHSRPAETIAHAIYALDEGQKVSALERVLGGDDFRSAIVFLRTKRRAKRLAERLASRGLDAVALQGNMSQGQRERALKGFRDGRYDVLVATDIAARGLDVEGVSHVVNFDVPTTPDAYTHRIGRTGRSERTGSAFTFVTGEDRVAVRAIEKRLGGPIERLRVEDLGALGHEALRGGGANGTSSGRTQRGSGRAAKPRPAAGGRGGRSRGARSTAPGGPARNADRGETRGSRAETGRGGGEGTTRRAGSDGPDFGAGVDSTSRTPGARTRPQRRRRRRP